MHHRRKVYGAGAIVLAAGLLAGTATPANASAPAPASITTITPAYNTVSLVPTWLPSGFARLNDEDIMVPTETGTVSVHTTRYASTSFTSDPAHSPVLYTRVVRGSGDTLQDSNLGAVTTTVKGQPAIYFANDSMAGFRWLPLPGVDVTGEVGLILPNADLGIDVVDVTEFLDGMLAVGETTSELVGDVDAIRQRPTDQCNCPNSTNMKGTGLYTNDWSTDGTNRTIDVGSSGNDVGVWQAVLWADFSGYNTPSGYKYMGTCDVDGLFGSHTKDASNGWQISHTVGENGFGYGGTVNTETWGVADNRLAVSGSVVLYNGSWSTLTFKRSSTKPGDYTWSWQGQAYHYTGYTGITFSKPSGC
jgi:hypothetical protein